MDVCLVNMDVRLNKGHEGKTVQDARTTLPKARGRSNPFFMVGGAVAKDDSSSDMDEDTLIDLTDSDKKKIRPF